MTERQDFEPNDSKGNRRKKLSKKAYNASKLCAQVEVYERSISREISQLVDLSSRYRGINRSIDALLDAILTTLHLNPRTIADLYTLLSAVNGSLISSKDDVHSFLSKRQTLCLPGGVLKFYSIHEFARVAKAYHDFRAIWNKKNIDLSYCVKSLKMLGVNVVPDDLDSSDIPTTIGTIDSLKAYDSMSRAAQKKVQSLHVHRLIAMVWKLRDELKIKFDDHAILKQHFGAAKKVLSRRSKFDFYTETSATNAEMHKRQRTKSINSRSLRGRGKMSLNGSHGEATDEDDLAMRRPKKFQQHRDEQKRDTKHATIKQVDMLNNRISRLEKPKAAEEPVKGPLDGVTKANSEPCDIGELHWLSNYDKPCEPISFDILPTNVLANIIEQSATKSCSLSTSELFTMEFGFSWKQRLLLKAAGVLDAICLMHSFMSSQVDPLAGVVGNNPFEDWLTSSPFFNRMTKLWDDANVPLRQRRHLDAIRDIYENGFTYWRINVNHVAILDATEDVRLYRCASVNIKSQPDWVRYSVDRYDYPPREERERSGIHRVYYTHEFPVDSQLSRLVDLRAVVNVFTMCDAWHQCRQMSCHRYDHSYEVNADQKILWSSANAMWLFMGMWARNISMTLRVCPNDQE